MSLLNEHGKCATWKFISNLQVITQNANKFDTKWAVPVKSETPTVLPSEIYCSTSIRTGSKHRVDTLNKTVITMWFTKQPTYFLGASVRTAMYQTVCCQRATTITTTTTLQEEKKKQIEFVANYGIICLKMANSLLLFPNAIEWFSFYFCVCVFAFVFVVWAMECQDEFEVLK